MHKQLKKILEWIPLDNSVALPEGLTIDLKPCLVSERALETTQKIRGINNPPAIILHGVTQRSGTNYIGELLGLHPNVCQYPGQLKEIPFLALGGDLLYVQKKFISYYPKNLAIFGECDLLPLFGSSLIAYLYSFVSDGQRILIKVPSVQYLVYFPALFPFERLLLLVRDGRDVVTSSLKTWPERKFSDECMRWDRSARMIIEFKEELVRTKTKWLVAKYEETLQDPKTFVQNVCQQFELDSTIYPYDQIETIPVIGSSVHKEEGEVTWQPIKKNDDFNPIGRWHEWTPRKKQIFKKIAGQTLIELGYSDDLEW